MKMIRFILDGGSENIEVACNMILSQILQTAAENGAEIKKLEMADVQSGPAAAIRMPEFMRREK